MNYGYYINTVQISYMSIKTLFRVRIMKTKYIFTSSNPLALHCATSNGQTDCVRMLVEHCRCSIEGLKDVYLILFYSLKIILGVDINGWTPLFYAVTNNHTNICQLLLDLKANPNHKDKRGRT